MATASPPQNATTTAAFEVDSAEVDSVSGSTNGFDDRSNKPLLSVLSLFGTTTTTRKIQALLFLILVVATATWYSSSAIQGRRTPNSEPSSRTTDHPINLTDPVNLTLYHINPLRYPVDPVNMNTADLAGAIFFDLWEIFQTFLCYKPPLHGRDLGVICDNAEYSGEDIGVTQLVVEVNSLGDVPSLFGPYATCNICENGVSPLDRSHKCLEEEYVCDCFRSMVPPRHPIPCENPSPGRESIDEIFGKKGFGRYCGSRDKQKGWCASSDAAELLQGFWYSTLDIGRGTTWRTVTINKRITKACHAQHFFNTVASHGNNTDCFLQCESNGSIVPSTLTPCWAQCFADATLGPMATKVRGYQPGLGMTRDELMEAWAGPFKPGVCPEVPLVDQP